MLKRKIKTRHFTVVLLARMYTRTQINTHSVYMHIIYVNVYAVVYDNVFSSFCLASVSTKDHTDTHMVKSFGIKAVIIIGV